MKKLLTILLLFTLIGCKPDCIVCHLNKDPVDKLQFGAYAKICRSEMKSDARFDTHISIYKGFGYKCEPINCQQCAICYQNSEKDEDGIQDGVLITIHRSAYEDKASFDSEIRVRENTGFECE